MNRDFHFFATYHAACQANFSEEQARKIAWAAEMVDELTLGLASIYFDSRDPDLIITTQSTWDFPDNLQWSDDFNSPKSQIIRGIWSPFHFLPGHFEGGFKEINHDPSRHLNSRQYILFDGQRRKSTIDSYFKDENNHKFMDVCLKLRCGKNSKTARELLDYLKKLYANVDKYDEEERLYAIGIGMHVFADTWAHDNFSGIPCYIVNTTHLEALHPETEQKMKELNLKEKDTETALGYMRSPISKVYLPAINSTDYLGHGHINHAPDYDFFSYMYFPRYEAPDATLTNYLVNYRQCFWSIRNPKRFEEAFLSMCNAMKYIIGTENTPEHIKTNDVDAEAKNVREKVFEIWPINEKGKLMDDHDDIVKFKEKTWKEYLGISGLDFSLKNGDIHKFAKQAKLYRNYILEYINVQLEKSYPKKPIFSNTKYKEDRFFEPKYVDSWVKDYLFYLEVQNSAYPVY